MRIEICSICGKSVYNFPEGTPKAEEAKKQYIKKHQNGRFCFQFERAYVSEDRKHIYYGYDPEWCICRECKEIGEQALWLAFDNIIRHRAKTVKVEIEKFPPRPQIINPDDMPPNYDPYH